jgi:predicted DNA-binding transcriptional regulator YafY
MPRPAPRTQVETMRRGIEMARMLREKPRRVQEIADELGLERRVAERLLAGLREAGLEIDTEVRARERYHSLRSVPSWLARAIRVLAA